MNNIKNLKTVCRRFVIRAGRIASDVWGYIKSKFTDRQKALNASIKNRNAQRRRIDNNHKMRRNIFRRQILRMLLFTVVYWAVILIIDNSFELGQTLSDIANGIYHFFRPYEDLSQSGLETLIIGFYILVMVVWPLISLRRTAGYLDSVYTTTEHLLDKEREPDVLPVAINDLDTRLRGIRQSFLQSQQAAKESEQRKNDLVVYLAHDLKTPLSSVIGYLTLLDELPDMPTEQRAKYTAITLDKAYRLEQLINEFFDITRFNLQSVELERNRIDLSMMLMQITDEFYPVLEEKGLRVELKASDGLMMIGDADKLMRVFDNLLRNAVSYSYEGTEISIAVQKMNDDIEIVFRNHGDQIPPQSLERLFEKFFRADSARRSANGGSGLGLAIAKHIVELHDGKITAQSTPEYTQFRIILPSKM